ncbi:hypothetical protein CBS63078_1703 [Aspergillus niger]|nr:hypothetical protein CBS133816_9671 [Aspergillus niger]KAI2823203.1 hypothetical protein CBS115989_1581 [Aspergillus niger]KAI2846275.1 hypothetical protein CBS11350_3815 [Aspergillus niger]KAI2855756.1 hypothetical protein CBS11232_4225 [Aspergillus niger]KAI2867328.1 hypothetical protein CBS12448_293 [Aspergillus niger]
MGPRVTKLALGPCPVRSAKNFLRIAEVQVQRFGIDKRTRSTPSTFISSSSRLTKLILQNASYVLSGPRWQAGLHPQEVLSAPCDPQEEIRSAYDPASRQGGC